MGTGPLAAGADAGAPPPASWRLAPACAAQTQGLVVSPFGHLEAAHALFLELPDKVGGAWLTELRQAVPITDATGKASPDAVTGKAIPCAAIAFTWTGLAAMKLPPDALASFSDPFKEGMQQTDRRRRLGDEDALVIPGGPRWSANSHARAGAADSDDAATPTTVHVALLLYAEDDKEIDALCATARTALAASNISVSHELRLSLRFDENGIAREHFGFADGLSQPMPFGPEIQDSKGSALTPDHWHGVPAGEVLLGHLNAHGEPAPGPLVKVAPGTPCVLPENDAPEGLRDLGLNGSYLVIRELRQDVARFWKSMDKAADSAIGATRLAELAVGRTQDGDPLAPGGTLPPQGGQPANSFGFLERDPHGFGCPIGSHIRRANPRDGLAPKPKLGSDLLQAANNHRLLRRGRKFGSDIADPRLDDGQERGLLFMALNTDLVRQFEFVQQNWMLNRNFATLFDETDPILGPEGPFTVPAQPLRRRVNVETFIQFAGGDYFFLPSLPALDYLGSL